MSRLMATKARNAIVFIHGLARKPSPEKLEFLWLEGLARDNPRPNVFAAPNAGIQLDLEDTEAFFNYYADVYYGSDYETNYASYYEADGERTAEEEAAADGLSVAPANAHEAAFLAQFEAKLALQAALTPVAAVAAVAAAGQPGVAANGSELKSRAGYRPRSSKASSKRPRWRPFTSCSTRNTCAPMASASTLARSCALDSSPSSIKLVKRLTGS